MQNLLFQHCVIKVYSIKDLHVPLFCILNLSDEPPLFQIMLCTIELKHLQCTDLTRFIISNQSNKIFSISYKALRGALRKPKYN